MAFTVEDGTGLAAANAYVSVDYFRNYHRDRGHAFEGTTAQIQQSIVRATDYIDKRFGRRFVGRRTDRGQALEWPRIDAFDRDTHLLNGVDAIPRQLQKACAEYALRALALLTGTDADLSPDGADPVGELTSYSVTVGPITESKTFAGANTRSPQSSIVSDSLIPEYPAADMWLEELLRSSVVRELRRG